MPVPDRGRRDARWRSGRGAWLGLLAGLAGLAGLAWTGAAAPAMAQDGRQDDCCLLLLVPVGARSSALGGAITAGVGGDQVFRNPAGLAGLDGSTFLVHHADRSVVDVNAFSVVLTPGPGAVGLSYQLFDYGTTLMTDETGQQTGEVTTRDHLLVTSFGAGIGGGMSVGASYRLFQERIDCRGACGGIERVTTYHAMDLGYRYAPRWQPGLQLGVALVNVPLWYQNEGPVGGFPTRIHVGAAFDVLSPLRRDDFLALRVAVDLQDELRQLGSVVPSAGLELDMQQLIFLRAGYTLGEGLASGAAIGVELRYDRFDIGVSRSFVNTAFEEDEPFQVTFGIRF
jgi:hypothetical protein